MVLDVSANNGRINWQQVGNSQPKPAGVYVKMNEGYGFPDRSAADNARGAANAGIPWGPYHFATLNSSDVVKDANMEADYFVDSLMTLPKPSLPLVLDIETNKLGLHVDQVFLWIQTFFKRLESRGYHDYALYSYAPFLDENLPVNHTLGSVRLWLASYTASPAPKLPHGWSNYWLWQYSNRGQVSGITGNVDISKFPEHQNV